MPGMITKAELLSHSWTLLRCDGKVIAPAVTFMDDGTIVGLNHQDEIKWAFSAGALHVQNAAGVTRTAFDMCQNLKNGEKRLVGWFDQDRDERFLHILRPNKGFPARRLATVYEDLGRSDILTVIFNSAGNLFNSVLETRWEFYRLPYTMSTNVVRFAESAQPHWYLDQADRIVDYLHNIIAGRYRKVVFLGMSSGGYASIYFSEEIARLCPHCEISSYAIQPQNMQNKQARLEFLSRFDMPQRSIILTDEAAARIGNMPLDLPVLVLGGQDRETPVQHHIFFDQDNPAEIFHVHHLEGFDNVQLNPMKLGLSHPKGCHAIFRSFRVHFEMMQEVCSFALP